MPSPRTTTAVCVSAALHAAALTAFLLRPVPPAEAGGPSAIPVVLVSAAAPPAPAPPDFAPLLAGATFAFEALPSTLSPGEAEAPEPAAAAAERGPAGACALADDVRLALQADAPRAALARIPERRRSVAGAVMLWDGGWVRTGALAEPAIARPIRRAVVAAVQAAEPACAAAPVTGPVVLIMPDPAGSLILVLGSGTWRWTDVATTS